MEDSYESMQQEDQNDLQMDDLQAQPETTAAEPPEDLSLEEGAPIAGEDLVPADTSEVQPDMSLAILEHALAHAKDGAAKMPIRRTTVRHFTFTAAPHVPRAASLPKANYSHLPERLRQIEVENLRTVRQLQAISNRQSHPYGPHKVLNMHRSRPKQGAGAGRSTGSKRKSPERARPPG